MLSDNPLDAITTGKIKKPPRILLYGQEKIGKSTWAASAPAPIFLPTEEGANEIDVAKFPLAMTYAAVMNNIGSLIEGQHDYRTAVIDSADWLERLIHAEVCGKDNSESIDLAAGGYGKGYGLALKLWSEILSALDYLRAERSMQIILIAHSQVERYEDPESPAYDRFSPKLHKKSSGPLLVEWSDCVLFATRKMRIVEQKEGYGKKRTTAAPIGASGGDRVLRCVGSPACVAGNRYDLPDELPLVYADFAAAMEAK